MSGEPFQCELVDGPNDGVIERMVLAYETWGVLSERRDNVILLHTGLSASSHAASTEANPEPGWWEAVVGPGKAVDTNKFFVVCCNALGGCYGSSGPASDDPATGKPYGLRFPMLTVQDIVKSQFMLLDSMGIEKLHASVGSSMGGMQSLAAAILFPARVASVVSISAGFNAHPTAIALRYMQRQIIMADPHWSAGDYYDGIRPVSGLKHARELATISYRSGPEWEERFGRRRAPKATSLPKATFLPEFLIETYINHQGEQWANKFDPNSMLYISKAMDMFDVEEKIGDIQVPTLVMGAQSDILFPIQQQRELARALRAAGNKDVTYFELDSIFGHDTFLLDIPGISGALRGHLNREPSQPPPRLLLPSI